MSRLAQQNGATTNALLRSEEDAENICPVCKSSRYLNPNMKFLVNPECYHKMCESCVDRIFSHGPAQCPVAGCRKTLRKHRFRKQTFQDARIEREVDIRRRVAEVFNRREEDFDTLRDYNNYLEEVEDLTFNLINGIEVTENERKLANYRDQHARDIKANASLAREESAHWRAQQAAEKEQAKLRRQAARREEEEEQKEREEGRRHLIDHLATGSGSANDIVREEERVRLKRSSARRKETERIISGAPAKTTSNISAANGTKSGGDTFVIRGLKKRVEPEAEKPYDPFGGLHFDYQYFALQDRYEWDWLNEARTNPMYTAGGYSVEEYTTRALVEGFAGLGVFIDEEMAEKERLEFDKSTATDTATVATLGATDAATQKLPKSTKLKAGTVESDDVFS